MTRTAVGGMAKRLSRELLFNQAGENVSMILRLPLALLLVVAFAGLPAAVAQEERAPAAPAPAAGDAQARFEQTFTAWKDKLKAIRAVQVRYQDAPPQEQAALQKQFKNLIEAARGMVPQLVAAAEAAYIAAPNENAEVADFLMQVVVDRAGKDNYEEALRVAKLLIDHDAPRPQLKLLAGVAAFATNQYDLAEKYLTAAQQSGALAPPSGEASEFQRRMLQTGAMYLSMIDEYRAKWAEEKKIRAAEAKADDLPRVKLETSKGDIVIELFENEAPNTTANFISLVEKGFYDGLKFHRVLPGFMAQGGDPKGDGTGGPGYAIACECVRQDYRKHFRGTLSMAHAGRDTGGSQFFLTFVPTPHLDGKHTAFGRVIDGLEVLSRLNRVQPGEPGADQIVKATVLRKREHEYQPQTLPER